MLYPSAGAALTPVPPPACAEAAGAHIAAVRSEFGSTHQKMDRVHAEAAALGGALLEATAAAAAAGSAVRQIVRPGAAA